MAHGVRERLRRYVIDAPVIGAIGVGAASYLLGFLATAVLVLADGELDTQSTSEAAFAQTDIFQQSQLAGFPQPEPTTVEFVGWIFYNAHFVDTVVTPQLPTRSGQAQTQTVPESINILSTAATQVPAIVYQLIPVILLTAGGYALARAAKIPVNRSLLRIGLGIPTGYVPLALVGTIIFTTTATNQQNGIEVTVTASPSVGLGLIAMALISTLFGVVGLYLGAQADNFEE